MVILGNMAPDKQVFNLETSNVVFAYPANLVKDF